MPLNALRKLLDENRIKYVTIIHGKAYTAQELAGVVHTPGREVIKTLVAEDETGKKYLIGIPADYKLDTNRLASLLGRNHVELIPEQRFASLFPRTELGAMPPFGNLFNLDTIIDEHLLEDNEIVFNAGSHSEAIRMRLDDYRNVVNPKIMPIANHL